MSPQDNTLLRLSVHYLSVSDCCPFGEINDYPLTLHWHYSAKKSVEWTRISPSGYATQVYTVLLAAL
jgi:hypothetical protein